MFVGAHIQRHKDKTIATELRNCQSRSENQYQQNKRNRIHTNNRKPLLLNDQQIEQVSEFPNLGSTISKDKERTDRDVAERVKKSPGAFGMLNTAWRATTYSNTTKIRIFDTNVKSVLVYGCATWKLTKTVIHQLQVLVNRCIRRILKIFRPVQISNQELWARAKQRSIQLEIRQRKWGWLGHTLRRPPGEDGETL